MSHKIAQTIEDEPVEVICLQELDNKIVVMNEALSVLASLNKPQSGFRSLDLHFESLDGRIS